MPIRAENRDRYPKDWPQISARVRERAGNRCVACGAPNGVLIRRGHTCDGYPLWREASASAYENGYSAITGAEVADTGIDTCDWGKPVRVVLTVAHLDHQPENCAENNLRAWCQRCHNTYDAPMRRAGTKARARAQRAIGDLLAERGVP